MVNKIDLLSDGEFTELVHNCSSIAELLRTLNYSVVGNSWAYTIVSERMKKLEITFGKKLKEAPKKSERLPLDQICIENSSYNSTKLRNRLIKEGIKENKCECCGITEWNGKPLSMQLHHLNGVHTDNRIENLQILCPNCHSQTDNYGSKNENRKVDLKGDSLPLKDIQLIMDTVREVGIVEARKHLPYRNTLINSVVKQYRDLIILVEPNGKEHEFATAYQASEYMYNILHLGASPLGNRSGISKCANGKQKEIHGCTVYKRSLM